MVRSRAASFGPTPFLENRCTVARRVCGASTPGRKLSCLFDSGRGTDRLANSTWSKRTGPPRPTRHQRSSHGNERAGPQRRLHRQGEGVEQYSAFAKCRSSYCSPAQPYLGPLAHRDRPNAVIGSKKAELSSCSGRRVCTSGDPHVLFCTSHRVLAAPVVIVVLVMSADGPVMLQSKNSYAEASAMAASAKARLS